MRRSFLWSRSTVATTPCLPPRSRNCGPSAPRRASYSTLKRSAYLQGTKPLPQCCRRTSLQRSSPIGKKNLYYKDLPAELTDELWRQYREGIEPLKRAGIVAVHFQFAPWVAYHPKSLEHIEECQRQLDGYQLAVEFRNQTWLEGKHAPATLDFERHRGLVNVVVDVPPDIPNTIPSIWEVTHPQLAIVRLHGRNHRNWNLKGLSSSAERFNYDYTTEELTELARLTRELSRQVAMTQAIFNNNYEDQGQRNGREMIALLAKDSS
jgi:uncharacterized protein YecE (DUF72 family)